MYVVSCYPFVCAFNAMAVDDLAPKNVQLQEGCRIYDWVIVKKLGEGGFGAVYEVSHCLSVVRSGGRRALQVRNQRGQSYAMKTEQVEAKMRRDDYER